MSIKYIEKKSKEQDIINDFNLKVLQKHNKNIKWIEKTVNYAIFLVYDFISKQWCRSNISGPLFLVRLSNTKLVLFFLNQVNDHNEALDIGSHMQFELKKQQRDGSTDFYLNVKISDSLVKTKIIGIWSQDPQLQSIYQMIIKGLKA